MVLEHRDIGLQLPQGPKLADFELDLAGDYQPAVGVEEPLAVPHCLL
jgi:hypothetical protein